MRDPKHIMITGASSGIGEAVALHYAAPGIRLALSGQNPERLEDVAGRCRAKGADVSPRRISVTDREAMAAWIDEEEANASLDLVIANAGVGLGPSEGRGLADITERTFAVNVDGVFHTIHPVLRQMKKRGRGQIAIVSSVMGLSGMPSAPAYYASKNAVRAYGEALRCTYSGCGVEVNVICPGFVVSRMTDKNKFKMPFLMTAERAAGIIVRGLAKNKGRIGFPMPTYFAVRFMGFLPTEWMVRLFTRAPTKDG